MSTPDADPQFEALLYFLEETRGLDFRGYKRPSLVRRVTRRLQMLGLAGYGEYRDYLEANPDEFGLLFNTILINVTSFFRDPPAWEFLRREVVPAILRDKLTSDTVRIWSAGCASGEEAYTLAMVFAEAMGPAELRERVKIYATDADEEALNQARLGTYDAKRMEGVEAGLRERYFEERHGRYVFRGDLRRCVIFGRNDLVQDAPISRLDLLVCRNTLMYFNTETQARILGRFHFALNSDGRGTGYLFLGRAEMLLTHGDLFAPLDLKCRIFAKVPTPGRARPPAPVPVMLEVNGGNMARERLTEFAIEDAPVARIVADANGHLVLANARARALFSLSPGDLGRPLKDLDISRHPIDLRSLVERAYAEGRAVTRGGVERPFADGELQYLDVMVSPLFDSARTPLGVGITFVDVTRTVRLEEELRRSQEEIQTANEELQSSNEELETTNEELQSSNEELQTVNEELRTRTEELNHANSFLQSVLASLSAGAVVVNGNLDVLMWNQRAQDLWGLRPEEVQGRGLLNLDIGLPVAELRTVIRPCLSGESDREVVVLDAINRRGKSIKCRVTCTPLITAFGKRDGVILTMEEA